jgi:cytochrome P450
MAVARFALVADLATMERIIELAVIAAAVWPLVRICTTRPFLRKLRSFPAIALGLVACLIAGTVVLAAVVVVSPALLRAMAVVAAIILLWATWRARPAYGRARGLPPGSLGILPIGPLIDHRFFLRQAERYGSVFKTSQFLRPMVCVVGLERCQDVLRRFDDHLTPPALPFDRFIAGGFLRTMPAEIHDRYAPLLRAAMQGDAVGNFEASIVPVVGTTLDDIVDRCARARGQGVAPRGYLEEMLFRLLVQLFFGIAPGSDASARLRQLYRTIDVRQPSGAIRRQAQPAVEEIARIVRRHRAERGVEAAPSLLGGIAESRLESEEGRVVLGNFIYIVQNARNDTAGLLTWVLKMLGDHTAWDQRLRACATESHTEDKPSSDLANRIIMETLRLEQSEFLFRMVNTDIECEGFVIPRGWILRLCIRESHRSPEVFAQPDVFDPDRFLRRAYQRTEYSPFGAHTSRHVCLGERITKTVGRVFLEQLAGGYEWRVVSDGAREFDGWHWTPSSRFRIDVVKKGIDTSPSEMGAQSFRAVEQRSVARPATSR